LLDITLAGELDDKLKQQGKVIGALHCIYKYFEGIPKFEMKAN